MGFPSDQAAVSPALIGPRGWNAIPGLVFGFGSRERLAPASTLLAKLQVHGVKVADAAIHRAHAARDGDDGLLRVPVEVDALTATEVGIVVGVRTADCVPLLLVAPEAGWAAAVHAGWRGTVGGIAAEAVRAAQAAGVRPDQLLAAIGPSIGPCCYEVSEDLGQRFQKEDLPVEWPAKGGKPHLDLRAANRVLLERSGVPSRAIESVGPCTRCTSGEYHSHRANPQSLGRQVSWIGWEARRPSPDRAPIR